jgi:GTP cyclohydrolase II
MGQVKVISSNPGKLRALEEAGLEIVERVSIEVESSEPAARYLQTKKEKMGAATGTDSARNS